MRFANLWWITLCFLNSNLYTCGYRCSRTKMGVWYKSLVMGEEATGFIFCCISGVTNVTWFYKPSHRNGTYTMIPKNRNYEVKDQNRVLVISKPRVKSNQGTYKCHGVTSRNKSISQETSVKILKSNAFKDMEIVETNQAEDLKKQNPSKHTFYCLVKIYQGFNCFFFWNHTSSTRNESILTEKYLTNFRKNSTLIHNYNGWSKLDKIGKFRHFNIYNFSLTLIDLKRENQGLYTCFIRETNEKVQHNFPIHFKSDRFSGLPTSVGILVYLVFEMTCIYILKYDILILIKKYIRKLNLTERNTGKYHFFFVYDFQGDSDWKIIWNIINEIEFLGWSTYYFHRDKTYGKDIYDDIISKVQLSDIVVILMSSQILKDPVGVFCMQTLLTKFPRKRRLYIISEDIKTVTELCNNKIVLMEIKSIFSSKVIKWNMKNLNKVFAHPMKYVMETLYWHYILTWLISSLPITSQPPCYCNNNFKRITSV